MKTNQQEIVTRRRWWKLWRVRISLRSLMILVLLAGVLLGGIIIPANQQRIAVETLTRSGGWVRYDWEKLAPRIISTPPQNLLWLRRWFGPDFFDSVTFVVQEQPVDDALMIQIGKLNHLEVLTMSVGKDEALTSSGIAEMAKLKRLKQWNVRQQRHTKELLLYLGGMKDLEILSWISPETTEEDLALISKRTGLKYLRLDGANLTEAGLMHLTRLSSLEKLSIEGPTPKIDWEARGRFMKTMPQLRYFNIDGRVFINKK